MSTLIQVGAPPYQIHILPQRLDKLTLVGTPSSSIDLTFSSSPLSRVKRNDLHGQGVNMDGAVEPFLKTDRLSDSERAMLMAGACAKANRWSPKKS
jgi:hypothetical protein